jgi:hypothetical protein
MTVVDLDEDLRADVGRAPVLPDRFWASRRELEQIRTTARSRQVGPDGVLAAVLARVSVLTDYRVVLPAIVGRYGSLNACMMLVGPPGIGKGSSLDAARHLLPAATQRVKDSPLGSGEGMVKAFYDKVKAPESKAAEWSRAYDAVLFRVDEGEQLEKLGARSGQTTMETLRSAWSGERLGGAYSDPDRRGFILDPLDYRCAFAIGVQPDKAGFLLGDAAGGTPQRFTYAALVDPCAPSPENLPACPPPLDWQPLDLSRVRTREIDGKERYPVTVADSIASELRMERHEVMTGRKTVDSLDTHRSLVRLKTSALLAVLNGRSNVNEQDWALAGAIADNSRAVREWTMRHLRAEREASEVAGLERQARRAAVSEVARSTASDTLERCAATLVRKAARSGSASRRDLSKSLASSDRCFFDSSLAYALKHRHLVEEDGRYVAVDA